MKVNPEIFINMRKELKFDDVMMQRVQRTLLAGLTATSHVMTALIKGAIKEAPPPTSDYIMATLTHAMSLIASSSHQIDLRRRASFKSELKDDFRSLCNETEPVTGLLFGEELGNTVKQLSETSKVTRQLTGYQRSATRFSGRASTSRPGPNYARRGFPFLGAGPRGNRGYRPQGNRYPNQNRRFKTQSQQGDKQPNKRSA